MRKLLFAIVAFIFLHIRSAAQENDLVIQGISPGLYINHTVTPKENYYSVGRLYNVSPKELAPYNNLQFDKGLSLGQTIKIPLTANNFSQNETASSTEALIPVYHTLKPKEGLYRVSASYNKISTDLLRKWNHLKGESVSSGTKLIVGYLKVLKDQSAFAQKGVNVPVSTEPKEIPPKGVSDIRIIKVIPEKNVQKEEVKQETKPGVTPKETANNNEVKNDKYIPANFSGGYFKKMYSDQSKNRTSLTETGTTGVFKTTSGWQDGKYYCFHNTAPQGTIIKITNNANGKIIYAKVLDAIPDLKQNSGLLLRLSNAAAEELDTRENKFDCSITYSK